MAMMNSGIILSGRGPDVAGSLGRGLAAGQRANEIQQQNIFAKTAQEYGPGLVAGDQEAVNAFARVDPQAAMSAQQTQLGMDATRQNMDVQQQRLAMSKEQMARQVQTELRNRAEAVGAAQAKAEAERDAALMRGLVSAQSPDQWDQFARQNGLDDMIGQFGTRQQIAAMADVMDTFTKANPEPPKPADEYQRYVLEMAAAGQQPLTRLEFTAAKKGPPRRTTTRVNADGSVEIVDGVAGDEPPKLTVDAGKNTGFYLRMEDSHDTITQLESEGKDFWQQNLESVPFGLGNYGRSPDFQKYDQARRDFLNAILRRESGAVISDQEFENGNLQYFPQPGDSPEVIQQKRRNRANAIAGVRASSGEGAGFVDRQRQNDMQTPQVPQIDIPDFGGMSDEELNAWIEQNG